MAKILKVIDADTGKSEILDKDANAGADNVLDLRALSKGIVVLDQTTGSPKLIYVNNGVLVVGDYDPGS